MSQDLAKRVDHLIQQSIDEEAYASGTLQRMALRLRRLGNTPLAQTIDDLTQICDAELKFFRTIAQFPAQAEGRGFVKAVQNFAKKRVSNPLFRNVSFDSPFELIEGIAVPQNPHLSQLSGPFFLAVAGDFSEGHEWFPPNRSYLFSLANDRTSSGKPDETSPIADDFELRVLSESDVKNYVIGEHGNYHRFQISLFTKPDKCGSISELFDTAVIDMTKYAFGPRTSTSARDAFKRAVEHYMTVKNPALVSEVGALSTHQAAPALIGDK